MGQRWLWSIIDSQLYGVLVARDLWIAEVLWRRRPLLGSRGFHGRWLGETTMWYISFPDAVYHHSCHLPFQLRRTHWNLLWCRSWRLNSHYEYRHRTRIKFWLVSTTRYDISVVRWDLTVGKFVARGRKWTGRTPGPNYNYQWATLGVRQNTEQFRRWFSIWNVYSVLRIRPWYVHTAVHVSCPGLSGYVACKVPSIVMTW